MTEKLGFEAAVRRIEEIAEELARNPISKGKLIIELRKLCGQHHTVPTSYQLEGVVKGEERAQRNSQTTEIWKGRYNDGAVALKVLKAPREDLQRTKTRFYKEVVLMKQLNHDNIVPFYGVSTTVSDFCLVFPWYENGNIMDYLKKPDVNRFDLLSGAANGLVFLHVNRLVHGALKPSHILIDEDGTARLATAGRSSVVAVPGTSVAGHQQSELDENVDEYQYFAPEIQWPEDYDMEKILITKESDVYSLAMVAYEVLAGETPYSEYNRLTALPAIRGGATPRRPSNGIADPVWGLLGACWSKDPTKRPSAAQVYGAFLNPHLIPQTMHAPDGRPETGELPEKLKLQVQSIRISHNKSKQFSVKFKYGNKYHTTLLTTKTESGGEHAWNSPETWSIVTNKQDYEQSVSFEVFRQTSIRKRNKVCATGRFSLLGNVNKDIRVDFEARDSIGPAALTVRLMEVF